MAGILGLLWKLIWWSYLHCCRGISEEALELSDLHCIIPMNGMVDSFNVSVAAGILMHHAVCDRTSRLVRWQCFNHEIGFAY